jgi:hypothetical protein
MHPLFVAAYPRGPPTNGLSEKEFRRHFSFWIIFSENNEAVHQK